MVLALPVLLVALLYASVGHAGASGYLAVLALAGVDPAVSKPTALVLNLVVASVASARFLKAGAFSWRLFWPFALASVPAAFLGGEVQLPLGVYKRVLGAVLLYASGSLWWKARADEAVPVHPPSPLLALPVGAALGFVSGLVGVGGGIFLSPLLILARWGEARTVSGVSALFILVNSAAALAGGRGHLASVPEAAWTWGAAALLGGWIGAGYGSRRLGGLGIRRLLAAVLALAGLKMLLT